MELEDRHGRLEQALREKMAITSESHCLPHTFMLSLNFFCTVNLEIFERPYFCEISTFFSIHK